MLEVEIELWATAPISYRGREPPEVRVAKGALRCASIGRAQTWGNKLARVVAVALEVQRGPNSHVWFSTALRLDQWAKGVRIKLACASEFGDIFRDRGGAVLTPRIPSASCHPCFIYFIYMYRTLFRGGLAGWGPASPERR